MTSFHFSVSFYFFCCCFELSEIRAILIWKWMIFQRMQKNCASNKKKSREGERDGANRIMKFDDMWRNGIMERLEKKQIRWRIEKHRDENVNKRVIKWYFMPYAHVQMNRINFEPNEFANSFEGWCQHHYSASWWQLIFLSFANFSLWAIFCTRLNISAEMRTKTQFFFLS